MGYDPNTDTYTNNPMPNGNGYVPYDPQQTAAINAQNMVNNQNYATDQFMSNLPQYQNNLNNQTIDKGAQTYNSQKQAIDTSANKRGLLYSGLKQGAEQGAANSAANQTQTGIANNNQTIQNYATGVGNQTVQSNMANYQGDVNAMFNNANMNTQQQAQNNQQSGQMMSGGMGLLGLAAMASDKNLKDDVKDSDDESNKMLSTLKAKTFSYKDDPKKGKQLGILAQDLEKSPMGKAMVIETPKGKHIDMEKALSAVLAVQSTLDKRLKRKGA